MTQITEPPGDFMGQIFLRWIAAVQLELLCSSQPESLYSFPSDPCQSYMGLIKTPGDSILLNCLSIYLILI